ncbi:MAG: Flagellar basal-body rod protein FlgG [Sodalis sp.]|nr:MAG: Flagellar basal-body rod protein FlgG [Sodalis sp.]
MPDGTTAYARDGSFQIDQNDQMVISSDYPIQLAASHHS